MDGRPAAVRLGGRLYRVAFATLLSLAALVMLTASTTVASPTRAVSDTVCCDYFDGSGSDPGAYWIATGHFPGPRWNLVTATVGYGKSHNTQPSGASRSMWFGDPATGEFGGQGGEIVSGFLVYSGALTSNYTFPMPDQPLVFMTFWSWEKTEMSIPTLECYQQPTCAFDAREVWVSSVQNPTWTKIWDTRTHGTIEGQWHQLVLIVPSEYHGENVFVRFVFNTIDARNNDAPTGKPGGWFVDEIGFFGFTPTNFVYLPLVRR